MHLHDDHDGALYPFIDVECTAARPGSEHLVHHSGSCSIKICAAQDLAMLFDEINVSTSMHRVAKLSRKYEVSTC